MMILGSIGTAQVKGSQSGSLQAGNWEPPIIRNANCPSIQINSTDKRSDNSNGRMSVSHDRTEHNSNQTSSYRNRHNFQDDRDDVDLGVQAKDLRHLSPFTVVHYQYLFRDLIAETMLESSGGYIVGGPG